jgi:hypothetical protein
MAGTVADDEAEKTADREVHPWSGQSHTDDCNIAS